MLVAVERDRLAPGLQIGASRMEIGEGRLALDKLQMLLAQRFPANSDPMILAQLLRRQSRAKIPVPLADDR